MEMKISHWIEMGSQVRNQEGGGEAPPRKMFDMKSIGHKCKKFGPLSELLAHLGVPNWLRACGERRGKDVKTQHANRKQFKTCSGSMPSSAL